MFTLYRKDLTDSLWWLFLVVILMTSEMNCNPKIEVIHSWEISFAWFEVGELISSPDLWGGKTHAFHLDLDDGKAFNLGHTIQSAGSLYKATEECSFYCSAVCSPLVRHSFLQWHWSPLLQDSRKYDHLRHPASWTELLLRPLNFLFTANYCCINWTMAYKLFQ